MLRLSLFYAVQLPGYLGDCGDYQQCANSVFPMRLQQQQGVNGLEFADITPTYDLSCPPGTDFTTKTTTCPFGSVHNVFKREIGARLSSQIVYNIAATQKTLKQKQKRKRAKVKATSNQLWPSLVSIHAASSGGGGSGGVVVTVSYDGPLSQASTMNCVSCCTKGNVGDFDVSFDHGQTWVNGTQPSIDGKVLTFHAKDHMMSLVPTVTHVRYTGNQPYPQCAIYQDASGSLPALSFHVALDVGRSWVNVIVVRVIVLKIPNVATPPPQSPRRVRLSSLRARRAPERSERRASIAHSASAATTHTAGP